VGRSVHHVKNSIEFVHTFVSIRVGPDDLMVSFDVATLFIRLPVMESLEIPARLFVEDMLILFKHVLTSRYFSFGGQFYEQTDGVAMGSPLSSVIMNFLLKDFEERALEQTTRKPLNWFRYVDGNFVIWPRVPEKLETFRDNLNGIHRNIYFILKAEKGGHLHFPDIEIHRRLDGSLGHKVLLSTLHTSAHSHMARLPITKLSFDFIFHFLHLLIFSVLFLFLCSFI